MITLEEVLREEMKDPEFKREWEALEPEFKLIRQQLDEEDRKKDRKQDKCSIQSSDDKNKSCYRL